MNRQERKKFLEEGIRVKLELLELEILRKEPDRDFIRMVGEQRVAQLKELEALLKIEQEEAKGVKEG